MLWPLLRGRRGRPPRPSVPAPSAAALTMRQQQRQPRKGDDDADVDEAELGVPSFMRRLVDPILRAASEIEEENPRVAFLCRFAAFEVVDDIDPDSRVSGVGQFKTKLLHRLKEDEQKTKRMLASTDEREIQRFLEQYHRQTLLAADEGKRQEEITRREDIETVLHDVLKTFDRDAKAELVAPSLISPRIDPIFHAASTIGEENPRVAYLCRFTAFKVANNMDPDSSESGVWLFKMKLRRRLEKDEQESKQRLASTDDREVQRFLEQYRRKNLLVADKGKSQEERARHKEIVSVLYGVLKTVTPQTYVPEVDEDASWFEAEIVLPSLMRHRIDPILRVASVIDEENPRVAYLCRYTAFDVANDMDPDSSGSGVRQFKTKLLHRLEKDEEKTKHRLASTDAEEIKRFFEQYCRQNLEGGYKDKSQEEIARHTEIASVLYGVLKTVLKAVTSERYVPEFDEHAGWFEKIKASFLPYNILPLQILDRPPPVMEIPEVKAAVELLRMVDKLPMPKTYPNGPIIRDLFDWLWQTFGFQKGNAENQKEHLILLLANIDMRKGGTVHESETNNHMIHSDTVTSLTRKIFENYRSWCQYLDFESNIRIPGGTTTQQPELLYIGLYLLIWGEASNVRFMPECLCYIFHLMAGKLYEIISEGRESPFVLPYERVGSDDAFLQFIIQPIVNVMHEDASMSKGSTASYSKWRNYDDLNEYFWSRKCCKQLKWPMDLTADSFAVPTKFETITTHDHVVSRQRTPKSNFVELRTIWLLFRSFDRMWAFFILTFQAMVIIAWDSSGSLSAFSEPTIYSNLMTIFITDSFLNFLQATFDIILNWNFWRSLERLQMIRYVLKFFVALGFLIILPTTYWIGSHRSLSTYKFTVVLYMFPNILGALFFLFQPFRGELEHSNSQIINFFLWWTQPKLYVARGLYVDTCSLLKYTLFWVLLLICKLVFSFYFEIYPLVRFTRAMILLGHGTYEDGRAYLQHNLGMVISLWAPTIMVYFVDTQVWYFIFSRICGGVIGAFSGLGVIQNLEMLRSGFEAILRAFGKNLVPRHGSQSDKSAHEDREKNHIDQFSDMWNAFITSLRHEDLISNSERNLLIVPSSMAMWKTNVLQLPPFLLASKIPFALDMLKDVKKNDDELRKRLNQNPYTYRAVLECYETLLNIMYSLLVRPSDKKVLDQIHVGIEDSIRRQSFMKEFRLDELPQLITKIDRLLRLLLKHDHEDMEIHIITQLQDIIEVVTVDIMKNGQGIIRDEAYEKQIKRDEAYEKQFSGNITLDSVKGRAYKHFSDIDLEKVMGRAWREKCVRLQLLLATNESASYVPMNLEARRRIVFFANSLFMKMPQAPQVRSMMSFSVLTTYFKEEVLFSEDDLYRQNEDGISLLFYLRKIYPDEWKNFLERMGIHSKIIDEGWGYQYMNEICTWASYRGQTLARTVRGMMYYRRALEIQCFQDKDDLDTMDPDKIVESAREARAIADIKFTYVVFCEEYGMLKNSTDSKAKACYANILNLMTTYPSLRVAYIDEVKVPNCYGMKEKSYYSVLVKGAYQKYDEEVYRIKLPGKPIYIGERKPENQNHAMIFTRGEALQGIDVNQDNYLEEAFKMRNLLEEFENERYGSNKPTILGLHAHIFTGSVSSLASLVSNEETNSVCIEQRVLANPLKVRFHYGHTDIFDRLFHITRGGISRASKTLNQCEGIFSGFNSLMRGGNVTHYEYMQLGMGRDVGLDQISTFEAYVAIGNGEQTLSRDIYRLGHKFDFYRMLSVYFTTVGFYFSSMVFVLAVYVFLYGRLYLVVNGLEESIMLDQHVLENIRPLESTMASLSVFHLGLLLILPMFVEVGVEKGFLTALGEFIMMQLQLPLVFWTFQLGTKIHYYGRTILHVGAKHRPIDRGFVVYHAKFAENYRMYSRSHFVKGLEMLMLLIIYVAYGNPYHSSNLYLFLTLSICFLIVSWLFAPFIFNPSCFEARKIADDWTDWSDWIAYRGGFGMSEDQSWEAWWESEQEHLRKTSIHILLLDIILPLRFLIYQYTIVYYLNIAHPGESILVHSLLCFVVLSILMVNCYARRIGTDLHLMSRILKALVYLNSGLMITIVLVISNLTISDVFIIFLGFIPTGWCVVLIGQAFSPFLKKTMLWDFVMELGRAYDSMMGMILFLPIVAVSWFPSASEYHTRFLFSQALSRGLQISKVLTGRDSGLSWPRRVYE